LPLFSTNKVEQWYIRHNLFIVLNHRLHVSTYIQVIFRPSYTGESTKCYSCWDPIMLTEIKYLKYIKCLCQSNKVEAGSAVFMMMRSVFLLLGSANLDVVIFYHIWMPVLCPLFLMHILLCCLVGLWYT
jgi:hypothetical protein